MKLKSASKLTAYLCTILTYKAGKTLSLDLCPVWQASFLFHISQQFLPILEGISVEKSKLR